MIGSRYYSGNTYRKQGAASASSKAEFTYLHPERLESSDYFFPSRNVAVFTENLWLINSRFSITPGLRYEYISTQSKGYYNEVNTLLNGDTIAPNQQFQLNVTDNASGSGFGQTPIFNAFATVPSGSISSRLINGVATNFPLVNHTYNSNSQIFTMLINPSAAVGTYNLQVIAKDNAGNRSATFNVMALQVTTGATGSSGAIDTSRPVLNYPNPWSPNTNAQVAFSYYLTDGAKEAAIYIYNQVNELVHVIQIGTPGVLGTQANYNRILWDGRDQFGQVLSNGVYLYVIVIKSDAGVSIARGEMAVLR